MSSFPSKFKLRTAAAKLSKFDLSRTLITTSDFGHFKPVFLQYCVPGDKINISASSFARLMPMPCPTFGTIQQKLRCFFVPMHTICRDFDTFVANRLRPLSDGTTYVPGVPVTDIRQLSVAILGTGVYNDWSQDKTPFVTAVGTAGSRPASYDLEVVMSNGSTGRVTAYFNFTPIGRKMWDVLTSLGLNFTLDCVGGSAQKINVLPLFAYLKAYIDWIVPSRFFDNWLAVRGFLEDWTQSNSEQLLAGDLKILLQFCPSFYEDDYFTSAFQNPFGSESLDAYQTVIPNPDNSVLVTGSDSDVSFPQTYSPNEPNTGATQVSGPRVNVSDPSNNMEGYINAFSLRSLGALQDMVTRGKLSGTKVQDWFKNTFGVVPSMDAMNLSTYYGSTVNTIKIGDVMATAGTDKNSLGEYAGRAIGYNQGKFSVSTNQHGFILITSELDVHSTYYQGLHPEWKMIDRLDFFQPEFDNLGVDAIALNELANIFYNNDNDAGYPVSQRQGIFGFTPRYSKMKFARDGLSGDFKLGSKNVGLDSWYLARYFSRSNSSMELWKFINEKFCQQNPFNGLQDYSYIFNNATNNADHFYEIYDFKVTAMRPMKSLVDYLETPATGKDGRDVSVSMNGVNN